ncbi:MAG: biopolymer transporter ExbD [Mediterranea massiliensis]|nr:biopolymer transporter ExbD [Mediterranea massiliensis]
MARKKRGLPEVNTSSTADIAFLLLIFFLVTTSMDTDRGLARQLPPPPEENQEKKDVNIKERNMLTIFLNFQDQLMVGDAFVSVDQVRERAKEFIANPNDDEDKPEKHVMNVEFFGDVQVTKNHVISLRCDRGSSYKVYLAVQNELVAAYNELRDELAQSKWGKKYADLNEDQQKAIRDIYPQKISEAQPKKYGEK